ncbi:MAG: ATP synthase F1 subunit gamma [Oscillospiraceae bacterium]|nr:ATP synthase F1 subunit gamma [Oscillospiraceae bacterium]MBQ7130721.1 ATP synthase F1 subunit gamma [Oscillospiraceae bacterium]
MAGVSTKEIKNRIRSMESTKQITKAMEMVAASKLRRAQAQVSNSRPYFEILSNTISSIVRSNRDFTSPYLKNRTGNRVMYIVIAGDRGLAGGYNSNVLKMVQAEIEGKEATVLPIGKKAVEFFRSRKIPALTENYAEVAELSVGDCFSISKMLSKAYLNGEFDEVRIAYTNFVSVISQVPMTRRLLPLVLPEQEEKAPYTSDIIYDPDNEEVFAAIVPEYLGGVVYGAVCESRASEQAARRTAMDAATSNAEEMIADLSLKFNRARQAAITNEIIDIVAGS